MTTLQTEAAPSSRASRLHTLLTQAFSPTRLEIVDESARHAGHSGAAEAGESHFKVTIVSDVFIRRTRLERFRMVHDALVGEFASGLHALSLNLNSPAE